MQQLGQGVAAAWIADGIRGWLKIEENIAAAVGTSLQAAPPRVANCSAGIWALEKPFRGPAVEPQRIQTGSIRSAVWYSMPAGTLITVPG